MSEQGSLQVTQILQQWDSNPSASSELLPLVYDELRAIARQRLKQERTGHTLQATALVHEAYIRMIGSQNIPWQNRAHFFGACANAMRQILVDHARKRGAKKRGSGNRAAVTLENAEVADEDVEQPGREVRTAAHAVDVELAHAERDGDGGIGDLQRLGLDARRPGALGRARRQQRGRDLQLDLVADVEQPVDDGGPVERELGRLRPGVRGHAESYSASSSK